MLASLRLQHYRSYNDATFSFAPGVTIVAGPNASGKTNLLEAILVIAKGDSYRAKDADLVQYDQPWARIDADTVTGKRTIKLSPSQKIFEFDGKPYKRLLRQHILPTVLFEPNHMQLLSGSPDLRRQFLDDLLEQTVPRYSEYRRHYKRVLSQRNTLLKKRLTNQLFVWDIRLSELGGKIAKERAALVLKFNKQASEQYSVISGKPTRIQLTYATQFPLESYETTLLRKLEQHTERDLLRGFTTSGPHRDDLVAYRDDKPFQETASRGENRTLVLSLKLLELKLLEEVFQIKPLLLMDDVFSELDETRRALLSRAVASYQTIITTTDADFLPQSSAKGVILRHHLSTAL